MKEICKNNIKKDVVWVPISGFSGENIIHQMYNENTRWYKGPSLIQTFDMLPLPDRNLEIVLRVPIIDRRRPRSYHIWQN